MSDDCFNVVSEEDKEFTQILASHFIEVGTPRSHISKLLKILRRREELQFLPSDFRALLKTPRTVKTKPIFPGHYHHFGFTNGILWSLARIGSKTTYSRKLSIQINVDGIPLVKSSKSEFWPILGLISNVQGAQPFSIGIFHGPSKPRDVNEYLKDFVEEAEALEKNGLTVKNCKLQILLSAFICDAPARAFVTCVKHHTGFFACPKCVTKGVYFRPHKSKKGSVVYPCLEEKLRNNLSFREKHQPLHHNGTSIIENLNVDMIKSIPSDPMHLLDLGIMKKLLSAWIEGKFRKGTKLSRQMQMRLNKRILSFRRHIPNDFNRKCRNLDELSRWKATEYRLFRLFVGPVVLKEILEPRLYNHFLYFYVGTKILSDGGLSSNKELLGYSKSLLKNFVRESSKLYGSNIQTFNFHNLIHLPDDVENYGVVENFSAYVFENHLQIVKNLVQKSALPLQQIVKRVSEIQSSPLATFCQNKTPLLSLEHLDGPLLGNVIGKQYSKVKVKERNVSRKSPNNVIMLKSGKVAYVENIVDFDGDVILICRKFEEYEDFFTLPLASHKIGIVVVSKASSLKQVSLSKVQGKAICLPLNKEKSVVFAL